MLTSFCVTFVCACLHFVSAASLRKKPKKVSAGEDSTTESPSLPEPDDDGYRCIVRATDGKKKISTLVSKGLVEDYVSVSWVHK